MFCIFQMQIIGCIYCAVVIICSGAFIYAVPISPEKSKDLKDGIAMDAKTELKEIPKWISIILSKNMGEVKNLRMKRQLDPTSAEALKQYWNWKNSNGTGNSQLRYGRSVNNAEDEQNESVLRSKRGAAWSKRGAAWSYYSMMRLIRKYYKHKGHRRNGKFQIRFG